jgi:hypothetical protein
MFDKSRFGRREHLSESFLKPSTVSAIGPNIVPGRFLRGNVSPERKLFINNSTGDYVVSRDYILHRKRLILGARP